MKKRLCLFFVLLFLLPAVSLGESADLLPGADCSFRITLYPESFSPVLQKRMRAYADFFSSVRFTGSGYRAPERNALDISISVIPEDREAGSFDFRIFGRRDQSMLSSNLLGEGNNLLLSNPSLLPFGLKTDAHLGLPLHIPMLLIPYVYEFAVQKLGYVWNPVLSAARERGVLTRDDLSRMSGSLAEAYLSDQDLMFLVTALTKIAGDPDAVSAEIESIPVYLSETVADDIAIERSDSGETWTAADGRILYRRRISDNTETAETDLPLTPGGYTPFLKSEKETIGNSVNLRLEAGWKRDNGEDLFDLRLDIRDLPASLPASADAEIAVSLSGSLFPEISLICPLSFDPDGSFCLECKKNAGDRPTLLRAEGLLLPESYEYMTYSEEDYAACFNILTSSDSNLPAFIAGVIAPAAKGMLRFLKGIPVSFCQLVMDDLTEFGVLDLLLSF